MSARGCGRGLARSAPRARESASDPLAKTEGRARVHGAGTATTKKRRGKGGEGGIETGPAGVSP